MDGERVVLLLLMQSVLWDKGRRFTENYIQCSSPSLSYLRIAELVC